ncbi:MAG: zinc-dependent dehydrogenase [Nitrospirota bacterium]
MRAAVYYRNDDIRIEERPIPALSGNEILVQMKASGICGTDVMEWYRVKKAPRILGHEMAGTIADTGGNVEGFKKGDRVFVSHHVPCFKCHYCMQGSYTACESLHSGNYDPGGFAEFIRIPEENVRHGTFLLPEKISFEDAAMIEPLACAIAGQKQLGLKEGQTVLIIGSGVSGILHIQLSKLKGAKIIATDINDYRLNKAMEFGAHYALNALSYSAAQLQNINNNRLADVVIVCAAAREAISSAISSVDRKGKILFFAVPEHDIAIPSKRFWRDEIALYFSYGAAPEDIHKAIEMISTGLVDVRSMITHVVSLSDIMQGFKLVSDAGNSLKVVVVPESGT